MNNGPKLTDTTPVSAPTPAEREAMADAICLADETGALGNVPVGALVLYQGQRLSGASNLRHVLRDPTAHAELIALRVAARARDTWRLDGATLIVTLEPCGMCAEAIIQTRIRRVVIGAPTPTIGDGQKSMGMEIQGGGGAKRLRAAGVEVIEGVLEQECIALLTRFFSKLRGAGCGGTR